MNYASLEKSDYCNGPGMRVSLFVSGCRINCKGCFNKEAQNFKYGKPYTLETNIEIMNACNNEHVEGLTILGGEPFDELNVYTVGALIESFRLQFSNSKTLFVYTGYTLSELRSRNNSCIDKILSNIDVLIDGPYVSDLHDSNLQWRGSSNQRILYKEIDF